MRNTSNKHAQIQKNKTNVLKTKTSANNTNTNKQQKQIKHTHEQFRKTENAEDKQNTYTNNNEG